MKIKKAELLDLHKTLYFDIRWGKREACVDMLARDLDVNLVSKDGYTALIAAAEGGSLETCKDILNAGAQINLKVDRGGIALHKAAYGRSVEKVRLLIEHGSDVNLKDEYGYTGLHIAASIGCTPLVEMMIAAGAKLDEQSVAGYSPLHLAADDGHVEACKLLIDAGADIHLQNCMGDTPLYMAAWRARMEACRFLVQCGADPASAAGRGRNGYKSAGLTPFQEAVHSGHKDLVRYFVVECSQDLAQRTAADRSLVQVGSHHPGMRDFLRSLKTEIEIHGVMPQNEVLARSPAVKRSGGMSPL